MCYPGRCNRVPWCNYLQHLSPKCHHVRRSHFILEGTSYNWFTNTGENKTNCPVLRSFLSVNSDSSCDWPALQEQHEIAASVRLMDHIIKLSFKVVAVQWWWQFSHTTEIQEALGVKYWCRTASNRNSYFIKDCDRETISLPFSPIF